MAEFLLHRIQNVKNRNLCHKDKYGSRQNDHVRQKFLLLRIQKINMKGGKIIAFGTSNFMGKMIECCEAETRMLLSARVVKMKKPKSF